MSGGESKLITMNIKNRIVEYGERPASSFLANPQNPRKHPEGQRRAVRGSLETVGWCGVVLESKKSGFLLDGHERIFTALDSGDETPVPFISVDVTPEEEKIILATLDRTGEMAIYDPISLAELINDINIDNLNPMMQEVLSDMCDEFKLDLDLSSLDPPEDVEPQIDKADELRQKWQVETGQMWRLGEHRLICGDCTDKAVVDRLMDGEKADVLLNDPPYGMRLDADFSGMKNKLKFAQEEGIKNGTKYSNVIGDHQDYDASCIVELFVDIKEQFWWGADYYSETLPDTSHNGAWLVWDKRLDESADKMYGSCFELLWSKQKHKRDILRHKWAGIFGMEHEPQRGRMHPNQKPIPLYEEILQRYSKEGCLIVDCYSGSGTTLIACERLNRKCRAVEIDPGYVAVAIQRWVDATGGKPELMK